MKTDDPAREIESLRDDFRQTVSRVESLKVDFGKHYGKTQEQMKTGFSTIEAQLEALSLKLEIVRELVKGMQEVERIKLEHKIRVEEAQAGRTQTAR